jgi:hypothetical protein
MAQQTHTHKAVVSSTNMICVAADRYRCVWHEEKALAKSSYHTNQWSKKKVTPQKQNKTKQNKNTSELGF